MSRDWFAVRTKVIREPKYRRLSRSARLALVTVWALAGDEDIEATWRDRDRLVSLLDGYDLEDPAGSVVELIAVGWLELLPDGSVGVHDWDQHQWAASIAAMRRFEAHRMREWRTRKKAASPSPTPSPSRGSTRPTEEQDRTENKTGHNKGTKTYVPVRTDDDDSPASSMEDGAVEPSGETTNGIDDNASGPSSFEALRQAWGKRP